MRTHTYIHTCTQVKILGHTTLYIMHVDMHYVESCMPQNLYLRACMYVCVCTHACMYVYVFICIHRYMYIVPTHIYIYLGMYR